MSVVSRKSLSKKLRFEIFKRDAFTCVYCGRFAPNVQLHVDHILAVAEGGGDEPTNLATSCQECNGGKGPRNLKSAVGVLTAPPRPNSEEMIDQLRAYSAYLTEREDFFDEQVFAIGKAAGVTRQDDDGKMPQDKYQSIRVFIQRVPIDKLMDIAYQVGARDDLSPFNRWKYFCGAAWAIAHGGTKNA